MQRTIPRSVGVAGLVLVALIAVGCGRLAHRDVDSSASSAVGAIEAPSATAVGGPSSSASTDPIPPPSEVPMRSAATAAPAGAASTLDLTGVNTLIDRLGGAIDGDAAAASAEGNQ